MPKSAVQCVAGAVESYAVKSNDNHDRDNPTTRPSINMKHSWLVVILFTLLSLFACAPKPPVQAEEIALSTAANRFILPWHQQFVQKTENITDQVERFCQNPSNRGEFEATQQAWIEVMLAWQRVSLIDFGPIASLGQERHIHLWHDSASRVRHKTEQLLAAPGLPTAKAGPPENPLSYPLSTLEYLLFDPSFGRFERFQNPRACPVIKAASKQLFNTAQNIHHGWLANGHNFLATFLSPGKSNAIYPTETDALTGLLESITRALETIQHHKVGRPFGGEPGTGEIDPYKLEFWRSKQSLSAMQNQVAAIRSLLKKVYSPLLQQSGHKPTALQLDKRLRELQNRLSHARGPLFISFREDPQLKLWHEIWQDLNAILSLLTRTGGEAKSTNAPAQTTHSVLSSPKANERSGADTV